MTNYSAKILNNAVGALTAQQAVIATTSNNIANVNTPGYARRQIDLQTRVTSGNQGGIDVGNGVEIGRILRVADDFVERQLRAANTDAGSAEIQNSFLSRIQDLFSLTGQSPTIGSTLTSFFSSLEQLKAQPSSIELRSNVIARSNDLLNSIHDTYNSLANMQVEADQRISVEVANVNSMTSQIASLNGLIASREANGTSVAADERDRRDQLLGKLSEKLNVSIVPGDDGHVNVTLSNGFPLVFGNNSRALEVTNQPSFAATPPPGLSGQVMSYIVYDYDGGAGQSHADLSQAITGGTIGGLLAVRGNNASTNTSAFSGDGELVEVASRVEALTRSLLTSFNETYRGPDRLSGTAGVQASSGDLDGNTPNLFGFFSFAGAPTTNVSGIPSASDLTAAGFDNFASQIILGVSGPRNIAAARDLSGGAVSPDFAPGDGTNLDGMLATQTQSQTLAVGSYSYIGTYEGSYKETITKVGNDKSRTEINQQVAESSKNAAQAQRDEVSGVSLDEEFTNLIKFQKAYQASARMIKIGEQLLDEVIQLI